MPWTCQITELVLLKEHLRQLPLKYATEEGIITQSLGEQMYIAAAQLDTPAQPLVLKSALSAHVGAPFFALGF